MNGGIQMNITITISDMDEMRETKRYQSKDIFLTSTRDERPDYYSVERMVMEHQLCLSVNLNLNFPNQLNLMVQLLIVLLKKSLHGSYWDLLDVCSVWFAYY